MTPTWYDLLGVEPDASSDEIRAAWKAAITDLDPGDRQFQTLNEAAEVLLDADRRAAYDATLEPDTETQLEARSATQDEQDSRATARRTVPTRLLAVLSVLTVLAMAAAGYLLAQPSDDKIATATTEAQSAAEHATPLVLTYDFRQLDENQKAVQPLLTSSYRKEYDRLLAAIEENADRVKPIVSADVTASGIVRASADRVVVLVLVERHVANAQGSEPVYQDQVRVTMERDGDDWLVDKMETQRPPA